MLLEEIQNRRSLRAFDDRPVEADKIKSAFEAARWAASSMNEQPWRFVYRTKQDGGFDELFQTLSRGNQVWAGRAPVLVAALARRDFEATGRPNRHYLYDTGQAAANMMIQLTHLGLVGHQMGGFHADEARKVLNVDDRFEIAAIIAVGYPGDPAQLPDDLKERELAPRLRKDLGEIVFKDRMP